MAGDASVLCTVNFKGEKIAELNQMPEEGIYDVTCAKVEAKTDAAKGRITLWMTYSTPDGRTIYDYIKVPKDGDKAGSEQFFKRKLAAFGTPEDKVNALKGDVPLKAGNFLGKTLKVHFFPKSETHMSQVDYILPREYADVAAGKLTFRRQDGSKIQQTAGGAKGGGDLDIASPPDNGLGASDDLAGLLGN